MAREAEAFIQINPSIMEIIIARAVQLYSPSFRFPKETREPRTLYDAYRRTRSSKLPTAPVEERVFD